MASELTDLKLALARATKRRLADLDDLDAAEELIRARQAYAEGLCATRVERELSRVDLRPVTRDRLVAAIDARVTQ